MVPGAAGLPIGCEGRVLALVSGGIDSAVAVWLLLKRGAQVDYLFYNLGGSDHENQVLEVIEVLVRRWSYGYRPKLWLCDLRPWVDVLRQRTPERLWQVVLKRLMMRGGYALASRHGALALATGEAIGQVSSQTLENLVAIESGAPMPVLRPLLGFDKSEIIALARKVGTYELSAKVPEYCALQGRAPATAARAAELDAAEQSLDLDAFVAAVAESPRLDLRAASSSRVGRAARARSRARRRRRDRPAVTGRVRGVALPGRGAHGLCRGAARLCARRCVAHLSGLLRGRVQERRSGRAAARRRAAALTTSPAGRASCLKWMAGRELVDPASVAPAVSD